ncbi:MAG: beta-lactamase family protein [Kangiellaceae bacterium]|nr:beta-lactamase family protein [Kangiellaceae bacterium]
MVNRLVKWALISASVIGVLTIVFKLFEPQILSMDWQPLPDINRDIGESRVYQDKFQPSVQKAQNIVQQGRENLQSPGISVAVGINGEDVWAAGYGYADLETRKPVTTESQFYIGSTSKALTSVALGYLIENQGLQLDDSIGQYLPELPVALRGITIRQLASHQSGIRNYGLCLCLPASEYHNNDEFASVTDALEVFIDDALLFNPGEQFSYSSYNFTLLSAVMEKVYKQPFLQLMQDAVFDPLNMPLTVADQKTVKTPYRVEFYNVGEKHYQHAYAVNNSNKWAGGGFLSTPSNLVAMGNRILKGDYLNDQTLQSLFEPQKLNNNEINPQGYAIGWRHNVAKKSLGGKDRVHYIHHGGVASGSRSFLVMFPEYGLVISVMVNSTGGSFSELSDMTFDIAQAFLSELQRNNESI